MGGGVRGEEEGESIARKEDESMGERAKKYWFWYNIQITHKEFLV